MQTETAERGVIAPGTESQLNGTDESIQIYNWWGKGSTGAEVWPNMCGEDRAEGVKDEWYLITFVKMMMHVAARSCVMTSPVGSPRLNTYKTKAGRG